MSDIEREAEKSPMLSTLSGMSGGMRALVCGEKLGPVRSSRKHHSFAIKRAGSILPSMNEVLKAPCVSESTHRAFRKSSPIFGPML